MDQPKRYTVTAALPYANGPIHIGHLAGCYLPSDIYVRYLRLKGRDVKFLCGSDEHGVAITIKARKEGKTPQQVVDHFHGMMRDALRGFGISFDHYSRTSSPLHKEIATEFFLKIYEKGGFEEKETEQYYDPEAGQFLADRYIVGECPNCHYDHAYGDQCERCGTSLSPTDLINPRSTLSGAKPELRTTKNWFLPLDKLSPRIREYVESHKGDWKSNVYGQCKSWLDAGDGLQPRSMTRDLDWGVPVPLDGAEGKVLYVWFDAPLGYITSTRELLPDSWETWWKDKDTKLVHFIGKDNIVFHCIIFPAILMEHGEYILPDQVPANEFLNLEGEKISTSRNWAVWLHEYLEEFPGKEDVLRYALCASAPETKDNDFTWKDFQARNNNELVAILGNFYNRVMVLIQKYYNGQVPTPGDLLDEDQKVLKGLKDASERIGGSLENYKFRESLFELMNLARTGNKYLADSEPWKVVKTDPKRAETILFVGLQVAGALAKLSEPFLPFTAQKMQEDLHLQGGWDIPADGKLIIDGKLDAPGLLFEKIEDQEIEAQLNKLEETKKMNTPVSNIPPAKAEVQFDDFMKMDIRIAKVLEAEVVPKTDKLLKLKVDTGIDQRTIVSGIAEHYSPEEMIGKQVSVLVNLAPRKIRGIESQGMILMAEDSEGALHLVHTDKGDTQPGSQVG
ncbi:MAG: methionine--tRNA ligase [Bacteroidota bacterium]|nr:methionine--tRNA ligase [Bacteroidota bacterium]MDX5506120.1 methionine--tRNA ligase [Bacteroidota bacterium]